MSHLALIVSHVSEVGQPFGPDSTAFSGALTGGSIRSGAAETRKGARICFCHCRRVLCMPDPGVSPIVLVMYVQ